MFDLYGMGWLAEASQMMKQISLIPGRVSLKFHGFSRELISWVLLGLFIRIALMPFSMHTDLLFTGDIVAMNMHAHLLIFNPDSPLRGAPLYPLLAYYTLGFFQILLSPFSTIISEAIFGRAVAFNWFANPEVFRQLFFFKIWYLIFDLGSAFLFWRMFHDDKRKARLAFAFWIFNPIIIYNAYFHGQFDVVPVFFTVLMLYSAQKGRLSWMAFFIGIAACYKNYPFFFLLPAVLIMAQVWRERIKLVLIGTIPYILLFLPRFVEYRTTIGDYGVYFFKVGYDVGFGGQVYIFFVLYAALLWYLQFRKAHNYEDLWRACLVIMLVYYQFSYFDLHYWIWLIPFAAIYLVERPAEAIPFYSIIGLFLLMLQAPTPMGSFFTPIDLRFFLRLPSPMEALNPYLPMLFITNVIRSMLAGTSFYLAWRLVRGMPAVHPQAATPSLGLENLA